MCLKVYVSRGSGYRRSHGTMGEAGCVWVRVLGTHTRVFGCFIKVYVLRVSGYGHIHVLMEQSLADTCSGKEKNMVKESTTPSFP